MNLDLAELERRLEEIADSHEDDDPKAIIARLLLCELNEMPPSDDLCTTAERFLGIERPTIQ